MLTPDHTMARQSNGGYSLDLVPRLEKETIDLSTRLIATSLGQTNFAVDVRAQLPYGKGLLVLEVQQPKPSTPRMGFLITVDEYDAAGNKISHGQASGK